MAPRGPSRHEEASIPVEANVWVHYDLQGPQTGPLVVLLPPLGGSGALFEPFRADLARDHRVLTCEPPGSGDSSPPRGLPSTRALARDVVAVLEFLGAEPAHLFGISLGGMVAQWVAIDAPRRVERLILASTTCRPLTPGEALTSDNLALARSQLQAEPALAMAEQVVSDEVLADADEHARIERAVRAHPHGWAELVWLAAAASRHDTRAELATWDHPTLVISGAADTLISPAVQAELVAAIPGARHRTLEGAGHDVTIERPSETAELVRAFIARGD
jgi:pimeloyl-ACP methyl ester carboxylesterase